MAGAVVAAVVGASAVVAAAVDAVVVAVAVAVVVEPLVLLSPPHAAATASIAATPAAPRIRPFVPIGTP